MKPNLTAEQQAKLDELKRKQEAELERTRAELAGEAQDTQDVETKMRQDVADAAKRAQEAMESHVTDRIEASQREFQQKLDEFKKYCEEQYRRFSLPGSEDTNDGEEFSFVRACLASRAGDWERFAPYEREILRQVPEAQKRDLATTPDSAGGFIVPNQILESQLIPLLRDNVVAFEAGVLNLDGLVGSPIEIPRVDSGSTTYWLAENAKVTKSDPSFGNVRMEPHILATLVPFSELFATNSTPAAETLLRTILADDLGNELDRAFFRGLGAAGQPTGLFNATGIKSVDFGGALPTYNNLQKMKRELSRAKVGNNSATWVMSPGVSFDIGTMLDVANQQLERRIITDGPGERLLGRPWLETTGLADNLGGAPAVTEQSLVYGDFRRSGIGRWGGLMIRVSDEAGESFERLQFWIRGHLKTDTVFMRPEGFVAATNMLVTN